MTTSENLTPDDSIPAPAPKKTVAKKTTSPTAAVAGAHAKPKATTSSKPAVKKVAQDTSLNPAASGPVATTPPPVKAPAKVAAPINAKPKQAKSTSIKPGQAKADTK